MPSASVRIEATDLWVGDESNRVPLEEAELPVDAMELANLDLHVHGRLEIEIGGRVLPHLGYFGPDDVCLLAWVPELVAIRAAVRTPAGRHEYDEGEQGQPIFVFERDGEHVYVSIEESHLGDGPADPDWQRVPCDAGELVRAIDELFDELGRRARGAGPYAARWWAVITQQFLTSEE